MNTDSKWSKQEACFERAMRCGSLSIIIPVSLLANVRSALHGQVSLATVNQILCDSWGYERLQKSKDSLKACFENVNIHFCTMIIICRKIAILAGKAASRTAQLWISLPPLIYKFICDSARTIYSCRISLRLKINTIECDEKMPQSQTTNQHMAPKGIGTLEHSKTSKN